MSVDHRMSHEHWLQERTKLSFEASLFAYSDAPRVTSGGGGGSAATQLKAATFTKLIRRLTSEQAKALVPIRENMDELHMFIIDVAANKSGEAANEINEFYATIKSCHNLVK